MKSESSSVTELKNPYATASFISRATFWYTISIFKMGVKREITESDFFEPLISYKTKNLELDIAKHWSHEFNEAVSNKRAAKLTKPLSKIFLKRFMLLGAILGLSEMLKLIYVKGK